MILTFVTFILFVYFIYKSTFFNKNSIHKFAMPLFFTLKILAGFVLYYIYNHFYDNRATGDVNKYFDDAIQIYKALNGNVKDYFKILFNIDCETAHIIKYLKNIDHWDLNYRGNFFVNDARTVIRFNLLLLPISGAYYYFHSVVINFISFLGALLIYNVFCNENQNKKVIFSIICFLLPSVVFWCSGVLKEGLLLFFLGLAIHSIYNIFVLKSRVFFLQLVLFIIAFIGILLTKFYVAFALIPAIVFLLINKVEALSNWQSAFIIAAAGILFLFSDNPINISFKDKLTRKQKEFVNVARGGFYFEQHTNNIIDTLFVDETETKNLTQISDSFYTANLKCKAVYYRNLEVADSFKFSIDNSLHLLEHIEPVKSNIYLPPLNASFKSIVNAMPVAMFNAIFLPTPFGIKNVMYIMPAFENVLFILLIVIAILKRKHLQSINQTFVWFCLIYTFCLLLIVGITTPVLGALVRYKVPALPFMFFIVFSFIDFKYINKISKKLGI